jgi:hypothetical protein
MPHKHNPDRRHHIPKMAFKVQNWPAYEAGLRRRGSLSLWIEDSAVENWQTRGPGGQARYADAAIQTSLMLRTAFKLPFRQTEGLMASVLTLMNQTITAPDHTTVSRRAVALPVIQPASVPDGPLHLLIDSTGLQVYSAGQWLEAKHGAKSRRKWRKLNLAVEGINLDRSTLCNWVGRACWWLAPLHELMLSTVLSSGSSVGAVNTHGRWIIVANRC